MRADAERSTGVLLIAGYTRSGSTLLDRTLGQLTDACSVGELKFIWTRGFQKNQLCGCGAPFRACAFWDDVVRSAFGRLSQRDLDHIRKLQRTAERMRYLHWFIFPDLQPHWFKVALSEYSEVLGRLYKGIATVAGTRFVIDSSKWPSHAYVLREIPDVSLHVVHLVRDSRGVAHSWQRKRRRPEVHWRESYMRLNAPHKSALQWLATNIAVGSLRSKGLQSFVRVRYEDFVARPGRTVRSVLEEVGIEGEAVSHVQQDSIRFGRDHTVSGNPSRFARGTVRVRPDSEWMETMPRQHRLLVTALTWPLLARYGYLGRLQSPRS